MNYYLSNHTQQVVLEGVASGTVNVTSGVPQGSAFGPILFLIHKNNQPKSLTSKVRLFPDDAIVCKEINFVDDFQILQNDIAKLTPWEDVWLMHFEQSKCEVLTVTRKRLPIVFN